MQRQAPRVHDLWPRVLVNPVFAVAVPNLAGLIDNTAHSTPVLAASYAWFLFMAASVWEGNRRLHFRLLDTSTWLSHPWKRLGVLGAMIGICTVPVITVGSILWAWATGDPAATWRTIAYTNLVTIAGVVVVVHVYETTFLIQDWESDRLRSARLEREKATAELEALQREVDPHALFNMLNALAALVERRSPDAVRFAEALAHAYRCMLRVRRRSLVTLDEEFELLDAFLALHELRAPGAVRVHRDEGLPGASRVPPMVLPELLENAAKHSAATAAQPLVLTIRRDSGALVVSNAIRPGGPAESHGVGLRNLDARCRLTTGRGLESTRVGNDFVVRVPLVPDGAGHS